MKNRYQSTRRAWEKIWQQASVEKELATMRLPRAQSVLRGYLPWLPRDAPILEAGSGLGAALITLRAGGYPVIGMDYAENALQATRRHDAALPLCAGDVHAIPCAAGSLGAYLSFGVLEHFEQGMGPALVEAWRVLRPGGVLVLTIPYPNLVQRLVAFRRRLGGSALMDDDFYESVHDRRQMLAAARAAGFASCALHPTGHDYTLWGLGGPFRAPGYYRTSRLAEILGAMMARLLPWAMNFSTLLIARKPT